jgi:hypothetical protein
MSSAAAASHHPWPMGSRLPPLKSQGQVAQPTVNASAPLGGLVLTVPHTSCTAPCAHPTLKYNPLWMLVRATRARMSCAAAAAAPTHPCHTPRCHMPRTTRARPSKPTFLAPSHPLILRTSTTPRRCQRATRARMSCATAAATPTHPCHMPRTTHARPKPTFLAPSLPVALHPLVTHLTHKHNPSQMPARHSRPHALRRRRHRRTNSSVPYALLPHASHHPARAVVSPHFLRHRTHSSYAQAQPPWMPARHSQSRARMSCVALRHHHAAT